MPAAKRAALIANLTPQAAETLLYDWQIHARDNQLPPPGGWTWWLLLAGRGFGKTRTGAEFIHSRVASGEARHIGLIAPTAFDARATMVEGPAGILATAPPGRRPLYEPSKLRLTWPEGAVGTLFSAEEPERLRGPQHDTLWADELGAWKYQRPTWDMAAFGFRLGTPRGIITTTPRPTELLRELLNDPAITSTTGSTYDNAANLAPAFLAQIKRKYEGTRLGRQELFAELLGDTPGALWTLAVLDKHRVHRHPDLVRVAVAIDPQAADPGAKADESTAETGIVAGGLDAGGEGYVLADSSGRYSPAEWGEAAVLLHDEIRADFIVAESNQGGAMVEHVIRSAAAKLHREHKRPTSHVVVKLVHASRGKATRAEPIAALDEQGRVHHVGQFAKLEDQLATWVPGATSPDRLDARVWLLTALMLGPGTADSYSEIAAALGAIERRDASPSRRDRDDEDDDDAPFAPRRE